MRLRKSSRALAVERAASVSEMNDRGERRTDYDGCGLCDLSYFFVLLHNLLYARLCKTLVFRSFSPPCRAAERNFVENPSVPLGILLICSCSSVLRTWWAEDVGGFRQRGAQLKPFLLLLCYPDHMINKGTVMNDTYALRDKDKRYRRWLLCGRRYDHGVE
jgi:hypothetical protein